MLNKNFILIRIYILFAGLNETLRKHPSVPVVFRTATSDYMLPNTNMVIPMGTQIHIPIYAIHHDETTYTKPELFNSDRFNKDNMKEEHPCTFIPFSCGPRACIGSKFAMMHIKITLVNLLRKYRFSIGSKTPLPLKFDKKSSVLSADDISVTVENAYIVLPTTQTCSIKNWYGDACKKK